MNWAPFGHIEDFGLATRYIKILNWHKIYQDIELALTHFGNQLLVSDHLDDCEQLYNRVLHDGDADDRDGVKNDDDGDDSDYDNDA